jgi:hypothetical protein
LNVIFHAVEHSPLLDHKIAEVTKEVSEFRDRFGDLRELVVSLSYGGIHGRWRGECVELRFRYLFVGLKERKVQRRTHVTASGRSTHSLYIFLELIQALRSFQRNRSAGREEVLVLDGMTLEFCRKERGPQGWTSANF